MYCYTTKTDDLIATGGTGEVYQINDDTVRKVFKRDVHTSEYHILSRLNLVTKKYFPRVISYNKDEKYIDMSYCGTPITAENIPSGWMDQINKIAHILRGCGVLHFDLEPNNILVHKNEIKIIDFERAVIEKWFLSKKDEINTYQYEHECIYLDDRVSYYDVIWSKNHKREKVPYGDVIPSQQKHKKQHDNLKYLRQTILKVIKYATI